MRTCLDRFVPGGMELLAEHGDYASGRSLGCVIDYRNRATVSRMSDTPLRGVDQTSREPGEFTITSTGACRTQR